MSANILNPGSNETKNTSFKSKVSYLNKNNEEEAEIHGYKICAWKSAATWFFICITGGLLGLIFHWIPEWFLKSTHTKCSLQEATRVLLIEHFKKYRRSFVKKIKVFKPEKFSYDGKKRDVTVGLEKYSAIREGHHQKEKEKEKTIPSAPGSVSYEKELRWFSWKKMKYLWDEEARAFYRLPGLEIGKTVDQLLSFGGLSPAEQLQNELIYGPNAIKVPVRPILKLLLLEVLNPFYIFQGFSVTLWYMDHYEVYASVIFVTSALSITSEVYQMHCNEKTLSSTVHETGTAQVVRSSGETECIPSERLSPGDLITIPPQGCLMQCDAILQQGNAVVNESMLTGESVPVTKIPVSRNDRNIFEEKEHRRHILFCGTQVIQTRCSADERVTALVIRTGYLTSKGHLVRSILYPLPVDFKFTQDAYKFVLFLVAVASIGLVYTAITKAYRGVLVSSLILDSLDLITIVVPPALPMAMTIGILYALRRLKRQDIFCISPRSINLSGVLDCIVFDKTGTLTEDGLGMKGLVEVEEGTTSLQPSMGPIRMPDQGLNRTFLHVMATCHSISLIDGKMVGDPLDLKMFACTGWVLEESTGDPKYDVTMLSVVKQVSDSDVEKQPEEVGILKQFPFSSKLQRMSVITQKYGDISFNLYCKGAPETIASLSKPDSVPSDFSDILLSYTKRGYRVLGMAWRPLAGLSPTKASREELEAGLTFLGLLIMENKIKPETPGVIEELRGASIRTIMATGDNILTAVSVGKECGIIQNEMPVVTVKAIFSQGPRIIYESDGTIVDKEATGDLGVGLPTQFCFAIDGTSWHVLCRHFPDLVPSILIRGAIFARMNPDHKQQLVQELQKLGYCVGMCGDGANDCGALRSAHVGISLSEAEASVASPFTSKKSSITCVSSLIREGRAALVTSFGIFKYMATYSLTQFVSIMILYSLDGSLSDFQFLYIDLFLITIFVFFFGRTESYKGPFSPHPPSSSLMSLIPVLSIVLHICHIIVFQTFTFFHIQQQPWFIPYNSTNLYQGIHGGFENYAVFTISQFQYIMIVVAFSEGIPYRKPLYTNYFLMGCTILMTAFSTYLVVGPNEWLRNILQLQLPPDNDSGYYFRWQIIGLAFANCLFGIFVEYFVIQYLVRKKMNSCEGIFGRSNRKRYLEIEKRLTTDIEENL